MKLKPLLEERRKEVYEDNLNRKKMGAWWRMMLYLRKESTLYESIPEDA